MNSSHTRARPVDYHQLLSIYSRTVSVLHHMTLMMAPKKKPSQKPWIQPTHWIPVSTTHHMNPSQPSVRVGHPLGRMKWNLALLREYQEKKPQHVILLQQRLLPLPRIQPALKVWIPPRIQLPTKKHHQKALQSISHPQASLISSTLSLVKILKGRSQIQPLKRMKRTIRWKREMKKGNEDGCFERTAITRYVLWGSGNWTMFTG